MRLNSTLGAQLSHQELTTPSPDDPGAQFNGLWDPNNNTRVAGYMFHEFRFSPVTHAQLSARIQQAQWHHEQGRTPGFVQFVGPGHPLVVARYSDVNQDGRADYYDGFLDLMLTEIQTDLRSSTTPRDPSVAATQIGGDAAKGLGWAAGSLNRVTQYSDLWRGLPGFRWEASLRTWCYRLARHALARVRRDPARRRNQPLPSQQLGELAAQIHSRTADHLRTAVKDRVRELRLRLSPEDQTILILRVDRDLAWRDIAAVLGDEGEALTEPELVRRAAMLRKRFERIKDELRALAKAEGLGSRD